MDKVSANVEFLFAELASGLTFARLARGARPDDPEKLERNRKNARKAYDSLLHFRPRASLSPEERTRFEEGKKELQEALRTLGENV